MKFGLKLAPKNIIKFFVAVNIIAVLFRTVQICALTESDTAFLKQGTAIINIIGTCIFVGMYIFLFCVALKVDNRPEMINCNGILSIVALGITGSLYLVGCILSILFQPNGWVLTAVMSVLCVSAILMFMDSAYNKKALPKIWALAFVAYWLAEFVEAYLFYTERPLRVRTVYETAALCFVIAFFILFGKSISRVKSQENHKLLYPIGFIACSLCMISFLPEAIAAVIGFGEKTTVSAVMPEALVAAAVFTGFFTINTFKGPNTIHPKMKQHFQMCGVEKTSSSEMVDGNNADGENKTAETDVTE